MSTNMRYLLIKPSYYSRFPPLGLLKLSTYLKSQGHTVEYIEGTKKADNYPDEIFITSLFTYAWEKVFETVKYYKKRYPNAKITLGGIYASLMPEHAKKSGVDKVFSGVFEDAENLMPDYNLVPKWNASIIFSSRGCPNKCPFCAVPKLEPEFISKSSIKHLVYEKHERIIFWDNNFLYSKHQDKIFKELLDLGKIVDFNQGLDASLVTKKNARWLSRINMKVVRLAYDMIGERKQVKKAIDLLKDAGFRGRAIIIYTLYNYKDTPQDFFARLKDMMEWGVASYPMRYTPLDSTNKNDYVSPFWTEELLEMIADARRVIGIHGTFPPYAGLKNKILNAGDLKEAMRLEKPKPKRKITKEEFYQEFDEMLVDYIENIKKYRSISVLKRDMSKKVRMKKYPRKFDFEDYLEEFLKKLIKEEYILYLKERTCIAKTDAWNREEIKANT